MVIENGELFIAGAGTLQERRRFSQVLPCCFFIPSFREVIMSVTGVWVNKRASAMVMREDSSGHITGKYRSVAGRDLQVRELAGRTSPLDGGKQMVGFSVCFHTDQPSSQFGRASVCTWSGWLRNRTLITRWLLTRNLSREEDEWSSTIVGQDSFEKLSDAYDEKPLTASRQELEQLLKEAKTRKP